VDIAKKNKELLDKLAQVDALKAKYEEALTNYEPIKTTSKVKFHCILTLFLCFSIDYCDKNFD